MFDLSGGASTDVAVTPNGRHVYVTQRPGKSAGGRLLVIDTAAQARVDPPDPRARFCGRAGVHAERADRIRVGPPLTRRARRCGSTMSPRPEPDLESIFLAEVLKILLQHNLPTADLTGRAEPRRP